MVPPDNFNLNVIHEEDAHLDPDFDERCEGLEQGLGHLFAYFPFTALALGLPWAAALYCKFEDDALTVLSGSDMVRLANGDVCSVDRWIHLRYTGDENGGEWVPSRVIVKAVHLTRWEGDKHPIVEADVAATDDLVVGSAVVATLSSPSGVAQTPGEVRWLPEGRDWNAPPKLYRLSDWAVAPEDKGDSPILF